MGVCGYTINHTYTKSSLQQWTIHNFVQAMVQGSAPASKPISNFEPVKNQFYHYMCNSINDNIVYFILQPIQPAILCIHKHFPVSLYLVTRLCLQTCTDLIRIFCARATLYACTDSIRESYKDSARRRTGCLCLGHLRIKCLRLIVYHDHVDTCTKTFI